MSLNQQKLAASIRDAARVAFSDLHRAHPDETFYTFALYTDDGWMIVVPAANSEEGFGRATGDNTDPAERANARWREKGSCSPSAASTMTRPTSSKWVDELGRSWRACGFVVQWNGEPETRLNLSGLDWKRRGPLC